MITYGNGSVVFEGESQGFEMKYKGEITILGSPDNLFISANDKNIIGFMMDGSNLPDILFGYAGEFKLLSCRTVHENDFIIEPIELQGVDYWELDRDKWEDDKAIWGSGDGTYLVGSRQKYDPHKIAVNNNIKMEEEGQYKYKDGTFVPTGTLIHIHGDGTTMTGGKHNRDSVKIYPTKSIQSINRNINTIRQTRAATGSRTTGSTTTTSSTGRGY